MERSSGGALSRLSLQSAPTSPSVGNGLRCVPSHCLHCRWNFGADQQKEKPSIISRYLLKSIKLRSMLYLESVVKSLGELPNSVEHSQALKKFCRWLEAVSTGWLQLSRHRFGRPLATTNDTAINPVWASSLRPDVVGFTCGSSPLSKGHCATFPIVSNKAIYDDDDNE